MQGDVLRVDPVTKLAVVKDAKSGEIRTEKYDYLVASSGSSRAWPVVPQALNKSDYLEETGTHIDTVRNVKDGVVVVGGGKFFARGLQHTQDAHDIPRSGWRRNGS